VRDVCVCVQLCMIRIIELRLSINDVCYAHIIMYQIPVIYFTRNPGPQFVAAVFKMFNTSQIAPTLPEGCFNGTVILLVNLGSSW
jgi:hypothetical protein